MAVDLLPGNLLAGDEPFNDEQYIECLLDNDLSGEEMADTEQYAEDAPGGEQSSGNMPDDEQSDKAKSPWAIDRLLEWHHEYFRKRSFSPSTIEQSNLVGEIMREEVWDACNEAEENQAPGPDGLPVELYLYCDEAREILYQLANHILTDPLLLTLEFTAGYITVQYKGTGNARELANYQSISLQNSSATIIADIIARHI
ncbi:hypothetical protein LPJ55_004730 [Coemansia sp. RSA 990]|nr:hypothetical protein LPJ55_004730 [Coemansia sp. RSA 990]